MQLRNANESGFHNVYNRYTNNIDNIEKLTLLGELITITIAVINGKLLLIKNNKNT